MGIEARLRPVTPDFFHQDTLSRKAISGISDFDCKLWRHSTKKYNREKIMKKSRNNGSGVNRRTLLAGAALGITQIAAPFVITARAAEAIKIGLLLPKSGPYS